MISIDSWWRIVNKKDKATDSVQEKMGQKEEMGSEQVLPVFKETGKDIY